jgi:anaerobic ribonucleoside-triphosphate reductase activating protein
MKKIRQELPNKTIWLYTGFLWEEIKDIPDIADIDVLCEGKFVEELLDNKLHWVGSSNQRVMDVKKSLETGEVVLHE